MISVLNLIWIVPLSASIGCMIMACMVAARDNRKD